MTERLTELLGQEAGRLDVPAPATGAVLRQGRGLRRRNRITVGACAAAVAAIVGGSVVALSGGDGGRAAPDPASTPVATEPVFSYGNQVFYDGPDDLVEVQDTAVKSLFYTSAGVLVRHGDNANSDGGGPQRFSLIDADGTVHRLGLETEDRVHATDPGQPYVAYAEAVDGELQVVVYDVAEDAETARVPVGPTEESWFPVSLDGDTVYVQDSYDGESYAVDWKAGTATGSDIPSVWNVAGGHVAATTDSGDPAVFDATTGEAVLTADGPGSFELSPDGRYAELLAEEETYEPGKEVESQVYDVVSGSSVTVLGGGAGWGWTTDGDLFQVEEAQVRICDAANGECTTEPWSKPNIPQPPPVTLTMSNPMCPGGGLECHTDPEFFENCDENPDECEWVKTTYVEDQTIELRIGGRTYES